MKQSSKILCLFGVILAVIIITDLGFTIKEGMAIKKHQIPRGKEDMYILKSSIVPPICPACPSNANCPREKPCPACPACARCPEPAFTCKKVPDYSAAQVDSTLPLPMLNSFSGFGQ
jgi:hypothetical protein|tara:strand:- start:5270 stop:5620 length:351 start_codon:yes stop_codon:yes gene_type:complete